ncbi:hypothetical protein KSF_077210 [Reticulibacter mediterranei]|uniref:Uncharacterized protein n=1 Tax=Reticulibacter mediterranei TaxID=2778369 RepID=A0A8J3N6K8_9CHLR|nr:hypothetical protein KSF_077210 [Reticulibacter mediterranei]
MVGEKASIVNDCRDSCDSVLSFVTIFLSSKIYLDSELDFVQNCKSERGNVLPPDQSGEWAPS